MMIQGSGRVNNNMPRFYNQNRENASMAKHYSNIGINSDNSVVPYANAANINPSGGKRFNTQRGTYYCTYCNNTGHTVDRCYKKHRFSPNQKYKRKPGAGVSFNSDKNLLSNHVPSFAASLSSKNHDDYNVHEISDTKNMNIVAG